MISAALTSLIAILMMIVPKIASQPAAAPHLLNQSQFDPLHHSEEVPEHVRR
jgi:hypothetical protein